MKNACTHIYYGEGKGKTTAAAGLCARSLGRGLRVLYCQFLKTGGSGEAVSLKRLGADVMASSPTGKFIWDMNGIEKTAFFTCQQELFDRAIQYISTGLVDVAVLDEALDAAEMGIFPFSRLAELISKKGNTELILTGRRPGPLLEKAEYCTEMRCTAHPYRQGQTARPGIEF